MEKPKEPPTEPPKENKNEGRLKLKPGEEGKMFVKRQWQNNYDFLASCLSMSVGLGNFWRFPYICYANGGGAFLIPYAVVIILIGRPLYYLDLAMGQFTSRGSIHMYNALGEAWTGIGITQCVVCFFVVSYYSYILAVAVFYFLQSFTEDLPWDVCLPKWGNDCVSSWRLGVHNDSSVSTSAELYLNDYVLKKWDFNDNGLGPADWRLIICSFITWSLVFLNCMVGIKSTAKASYFLGLFPILVMTVLLIRAATIPGAGTGLLYLLTPVWEKIFHSKVWMEAIAQVYFSLGIGFNLIANYASYNDIHQNINRCALLMAIADTFCSILASLTIFASLGSLAKRINVPINKVLKGAGMTLVFVSYADAIAKFDTIPYIFAIVFFIMFFSLGLGSLVGFVHVISTNAIELWPDKLKEWHAALMISGLGFFASIIYTTRAGSYVLDMVDCYGSVYVLSLVAFFQTIAMIYSHGLTNWCWNLEFISKSNTSFYWRWTWAFICPFGMLLIYFYSLIASSTTLPDILKYIGVCLLILATSPIPILMLISIIKYRKEGFIGSFKKAFSSVNWQPYTDANIIAHQEFIDEKMAAFKLPDAKPHKKFFYSLTHKR